MSWEDLENKIGFTFKNKDLLLEALTHRSYLNENPESPSRHNERLEFLGDAVLELVVTENLFAEFPDKEEGDLTVLRAALVNSKILADISNGIGLTDIVLMSRGELKEQTQAKGREKIAANTLEALIGAIYLDNGYEPAKKFVDRFIMSNIESVKAEAKDSKSIVQEMAQNEFKITPTYKILEETGPAHDRTFRAGLYFGEEMQGEGVGKSKQEAELIAAKEWLKGRA